MKQRFLALAEEVKKAGIAEAIYNTSNAEELKAIWKKFLDENQELVAKIEFWREEYTKPEAEKIFAKGEEIQNPMEVVIIIRIIDDIVAVSECELCEESDDLAQAIKEIGNNFTITLGELMEYSMISNISAEEIFFLG